MKSLIYDKVSQKLSTYNFNYSIIFKDLTSLEIITWSNNPYSEKITFSSASTIKIFIAIEAFNQINRGLIFEDVIILLDDTMKVGGSGILYSYPNNSEISIKKLIYLMMTQSDNTATNILIDILGMNNINVTINKLLCKNSALNRKMMDCDSIKRGIDNYTSAADLTIVLEKLYTNTCINKKYDTLILNIMKHCANTSKIPKKLPSNITVSHKTGELDFIENDAGIIFTPYGDYILTILTQGCNNLEEIEAISELSKIIYDSYSVLTNSKES